MCVVVSQTPFDIFIIGFYRTEYLMKNVTYKELLPEGVMFNGACKV